MTARWRQPHVLIGGTPRSGTTLIQRSLVEWCDVAIPPETHFFTVLFSGHEADFYRKGDRFDAQELLRHWRSLPISNGQAVDWQATQSALATAHGDVFDVFTAVLAGLTPRCSLVGEKTPGHLAWFSRLAIEFPDTKFICVVRDPRAVAASYAAAPFGLSSPLLAAEAWNTDVLAAQRLLKGHPTRTLLVRYEDAIDNYSRTMTTIARFLGLQLRSTPSDVLPTDLYLTHETWKSRAIGPISPDRNETAIARLTNRMQRRIEHICSESMDTVGYGSHPLRLQIPALATQRFRRMRYRRARSQRDRMIAAVPTVLTPAGQR